MGFSYSRYGLCCDFCGKSKPQDNVKKIACPYGGCQAWACCKVCKAKKLHLQSSCGGTTHKDTCKKSKMEYDAKHKTKEDLINSGHFVRVSARQENDQVFVTFQGKDSSVVYSMPQKTYDSVPISQVATVGTYANIGYIRRIEELVQ